MYRISRNGRQPIVSVDSFEETEPVIRAAKPVVSMWTRSATNRYLPATLAAVGVPASNGPMGRL
jgi:hypothetical protein